MLTKIVLGPLLLRFSTARKIHVHSWLSCELSEQIIHLHVYSIINQYTITCKLMCAKMSKGLINSSNVFHSVDGEEEEEEEEEAQGDTAGKMEEEEEEDTCLCTLSL